MKPSRIQQEEEEMSMRVSIAGFLISLLLVFIALAIGGE